MIQSMKTKLHSCQLYYHFRTFEITHYIFSTTALIVTVAITVAKTTLSILGAFSLLMKLGFLYLPQIFLIW